MSPTLLGETGVGFAVNIIFHNSGTFWGSITHNELMLTHKVPDTVAPRQSPHPLLLWRTMSCVTAPAQCNTTTYWTSLSLCHVAVTNLWRIPSLCVHGLLFSCNKALQNLGKTVMSLPLNAFHYALCKNGWLLSSFHSVSRDIYINQSNVSHGTDKSNQQLFSHFFFNHWTALLSPDNYEYGSDTRGPHAPAILIQHGAQISYLLIYELSCKKPQLRMIHPYKLCKSVVCVYDNKWVLLDGKTQVPRTRTLCTVDVRYGISVNTSTNPYLQVDAFPKAYQASSIIPVCQSTGSEPDPIPTMQHCLVGRYKSRESMCLFPQIKTHTASSLPAFSFLWSKFGPMPVLAIAVIKY